MSRRYMVAAAVIVLVTVLVVVLALLNRGKQPEPGILKVGVVLPLTGPAADQGKDILSGIEMARDEINGSRKNDDPKVELIIEDSMASPKGGVSALEKLIQTERPPAVIGPIASSVMLAMIPVAEREKVVLLSPAASSPQISNAGRYIFRISLLAPPQARALAKFAKDELSAERAAVLYVNDDSGISYRDAFRDAFAAQGGTVVFEDSYEKTGTDFRTQLTKLKAANAEITFVPGIPQTVGLILKQARELGVDTQFLGNYGTEGESLLTLAGNAAEGFIYTSIPVSDEFVKSFDAKFGRHPTIGAPLGYDALQVVAHVAKAHGTSSEAIRKGLSELRDYDGATGLTTILPSGDAEKEVTLKAVSNGAFTGYRVGQQ
ncbi:MAG: ABC transporter substrate-binding protein [Verrucomicrobia bacterium]|nr:ABC transporter substrate-binding protein [Verrucomicrobiota bacterium]